MLALSTFGNNKNGSVSEIEGLSMDNDEFDDFTSESFLNSIDFDDLFLGIGNGDDLLPDLEMDPETFPEFSVSSFQDNSGMNFSPNSPGYEEEKAAVSLSVSDLGSGISGSSQSEEIISKILEPVIVKASFKDGDTGRKSSAQSKKTSGKKKVKVDWTPELHRRFVQAVEQIGIDKAVPSRILELMGLDSLTRHNIASHLQKYRSHRRHLQAREAEAASWTHMRQMYAAVPSSRSGQKPLEKKVTTSWIAPTMGFPRFPPSMPPHFKPLHVWGHPSADQSFMHIWPKHLTPPPLPHPYAWPPVHHPHFFPAPTRHHITPKLPGVPPMSSVVPSPRPGQTMPQSPSDIYPSKETVDAAIGDILSKPWQPLPLGLKPPSIDTVMLELQSQGISKIPPSCA